MTGRRLWMRVVDGEGGLFREGELSRRVGFMTDLDILILKQVDLSQKEDGLLLNLLIENIYYKQSKLKHDKI